MPDDRLSHPRIGRSRKVSQLDHLEYRVWDQYRLSADDFGVMPDSASVIRGANIALERESEKRIQQALGKLVDVGLVHRFEHQDVNYLYSRNWQEHQKVRYPRGTHYPCPPPDELLRCDDKTLELFAKHSGNPSAVSLGSSGSLSVPPTRGDARNADANANADAEKRGESERGSAAEGPDQVDARAFLKEFGRLYAHHRHGAAYFIKWKEHMAIVKNLLKLHAHDRLVLQAKVLLTTDDEWISGTDRGVEILAKKINWLEDRVADWESRRGVA
jgi:hypothetical protein